MLDLDIIAPTISIAAPTVGSNIGDFLFNEVVTGSTSGVTGELDLNSTTNVLEVASVSGSFTVGETLTGSTSGQQEL